MRRPIALAASVLLGVTMAAAPVSVPLANAVVHAPRIALRPDGSGHGHGGGGGGGGSGFGWASSNWSGYAVSSSDSGAFSSVSGEWTVPAVQPSSGTSYSSSWVGIDGFNNSSLIQTGTEQDYVNGRATYYAWWEILPAAETVITAFAVSPGDSIGASIVPAGSGHWTITITDQTRGETFHTTQAYSGPGTSAEWIEEAPTIGGHVATLAHYGRATFDPGTVNGKNPGLVASDGGVMIQRRAQVSTPSLPDNDTDGFNVAYGSTQPNAPES